MILLDHHTMTTPFPEALEALQKHLTSGPLEVPYQDDETLFDVASHSIDEISQLVGAGDEHQIVFTSGRGEGIAQVFQSYLLDEAMTSGKNHIMTVSTEEADILLTLERMHQVGIEPQIATVNSMGHLTSEILDLFSGPRLGLLSISWANRHTGVVQPIWEIAEYCKEHGILLHVDATDVVGRLFLSAGDLPIDFLTIEGSRIGAPIGTGALIARKKISPLIPSGEASSLRGGLLNLPGLASLGAAARMQREHLQHVCMETARLKHHFESALSSQIEGAEILFKQCDRLPTTSAIAFEGVHAEALLFYLTQNELTASMGGGDAQRLEILLGATGVPPEKARGALSFCLSHNTTQEELDRAVSIVQAGVQHLRKVAGPLVEEADV